jgi:gamma-glutamylcyclotransferase (GGCT)/AIG2-like uncharacterized protein YtfP
LDNPPPGLRLFVYGTLKRGFPAHERFFGTGAEAEPALVRGSLFDLPAGFPALSVPPEDVLATGTASAPEDAEKQRGFSLDRSKRPSPKRPSPNEAARGEVFTLEDPGKLLPALDAFEGFDPGGESLYERVLIPAWTESGQGAPVWAYVMESPRGRRLPRGLWPEGC